MFIFLWLGNAFNLEIEWRISTYRRSELCVYGSHRNQRQTSRNVMFSNFFSFFSDFRRSKTMHTPHFPQHTAISVNLVSFLSFCQPNFQRNGSLIAKAYHWRRSKTPLLKLFHLTRKLQICVQIVSLIIIGIRINVEQAIPKKMLLNGIFNLHSPFALDLAWVLV